MFYFKNARNNSCEKFGKSAKLNFEITILFVFEMNDLFGKEVHRLFEITISLALI